MRKILAFLKKWRIKETPRKTGSAPIALPPEGSIAKLWKWTLPLLLGFTAAWFFMTCLEAWLENENVQAYFAFVSSADLSPQEQDAQAESDMTSFLRHNPFKVTPMPLPKTAILPVSSPRDQLREAVLLWPVAEIGAWLEDQGQQRIVMIGNKFGDYTLESVDGYSAVFIKDGERFIKDLLYGSEARTAAVRREPKPIAAQAAPAQAEGEIDRSLIAQLLENWHDEMRKIRFRPSTDGEGLRIQWLNRESVLAQISLRQNDVIRSINGIPLRSMGDISNSIGSLANSDFLTVELTRSGASLFLQYSVR